LERDISMHPEHASFLADIDANPEDDRPRLVFADWLEDHGDPDRADFIRVQCELAQPEDEDPRRGELLDREQQLLDGHRQRVRPRR
jgi:uncharacterized protein (TIGR02996 family)